MFSNILNDRVWKFLAVAAVATSMWTGVLHAASEVANLESRLKPLAEKLKRQKHSEVFDAFLKESWAYTMEIYPDWATYVGYPGLNDRMADNSLAAIRSRKGDADRNLAFLAQVKREQLTPQQQTTYDVLTAMMKNAAAFKEFPTEFLAINQMGNTATSLPQLMEVMPRESAKDMQDRLTRMRAFGQMLENDEIAMREGLKQGVTVPFAAIKRVPVDFHKLMPKDIKQSPYLADFKTMPASMSAADQAKVRAEAEEIVRTSIYPKLASLTKFLETEYVPKARKTVGLSDLPNGRAWYDAAIRDQTTTNLTADEVHEIGLKEVARLAKEIDKVKDEMKFKGTHKEFLKYMFTDRKFRFQSASEMVTAYRAAGKRIDEELPAIFATLPRQPYGVREVPAYIAESNTAAYYQNASLEKGKAGLFYINTSRPKEQTIWEVESLTSHEAVPGHHLQIAIAAESGALPEVRRYAGFTAYVEGWALYAETLGYGFGLYKNPASRFGQLSNEIWRACRLVVDTGMHAKGWTREKALQFMVDHIAKDQKDLAIEIDRYIVWPGQALAYKIGALKIQELRKKATETLGQDFKLREFHDVVLAEGSVPLNVLEARVDSWIESKGGKRLR